jgi:RNA polymerase subunit RPABC4/transcription elongation factor Spt4
MTDDMQTCPRCGLIHLAADTICPRCGFVEGEERAVEQPSSAGPTLVRTVTCSNCGAVSPEGTQMCPSCGRELSSPGYSPSSVWPPGPAGQVDPGPTIIRLLTGSTAGDIWIGIAATLVGIIGTAFTFGISLVATVIAYFMLRPKYPVFHRGMSYGFAVIFFMLMAPCLFCLAGSAYPSLHKIFPWIQGL